MKVAVLMSTYNGEKYIREQIDSILSQEGNFQIDLWIRDDGSTDSTRDILQKYKKTKRLNWFTGENLGPARSYMNLLHHCKGYDFYAFSDQDDFWLPEKLQRGISFIKKEKLPALYFANAQLVDADLNYLGRNVYEKSPKLDIYTVSCAGGLLGCTMVFNKVLAVKIQEKPIPLRMVMHDFYTASACLVTGGKIFYDKMASMKYRQHGENVVGVSCGLKNKIVSRVKAITKKNPVSIADQAESLISNYKEDMDENVLKWIYSVADYPTKLKSRIGVSLSPKVRYINFNMGLKNRVAILLGNR